MNCNRMRTTVSSPQAAKLFFERANISDDAKEVLQNADCHPVISEFESELKAAEDLSSQNIMAIQKGIGKKLSVKGKGLFMPIRAVVTGQTHGPELAKIISLLGKDAVLERISSIKSSVGI